MGSGEGGLAAFLREDQPSRQYMRQASARFFPLSVSGAGRLVTAPVARPPIQTLGNGGEAARRDLFWSVVTPRRCNWQTGMRGRTQLPQPCRQALSPGSAMNRAG